MILKIMMTGLVLSLLSLKPLWADEFVVLSGKLVSTFSKKSQDEVYRIKEKEGQLVELKSSERIRALFEPLLGETVTAIGRRPSKILMYVKSIREGAPYKRIIKEVQGVLLMKKHRDLFLEYNNSKARVYIDRAKQTELYEQLRMHVGKEIIIKCEEWQEPDFWKLKKVQYMKSI